MVVAKLSLVKPTLTPITVSPLIRTIRWALLGAGIYWGALRHSQISAEEKILREKEAIEGPIREAKALEAKNIATKVEMRKLAVDLGYPIPEGY
jgi:hypothetical protein